MSKETGKEWCVIPTNGSLPKEPGFLRGEAWGSLGTGVCTELAGLQGQGGAALPRGRPRLGDGVRGGEVEPPVSRFLVKKPKSRWEELGESPCLMGAWPFGVFIAQVAHRVKAWAGHLTGQAENSFAELASSSILPKPREQRWGSFLLCAQPRGCLVPSGDPLTAGYCHPPLPPPQERVPSTLHPCHALLRKST